MIAVKSKSKSDLLSKLSESICIKNNIPVDKASVLQDELSTTISQFINNVSVLTELMRDAVHIASSKDTFILNSPLDKLTDLNGLIINSENRVINLYCTVSGTVDKYTIHVFDDEGDSHLDIDPEKCVGYIRIGTVSKNEDGIWSVVIDESLPSELVDIKLYSKCWSTHDKKSIKDFINDVYNRIMQVGQYHPEGNRSLTNESISLKESDDNDDQIQYTIEYNPDEVIVYIHENLEDDNDITEETDEDKDNKIQSFFESIFNVDDSEVIKVNEKLSKIIINVGASYALGKGTLALLKGVTKNISSNPYTNKNNEIMRQQLSNKGSAK